MIRRGHRERLGDGSVLVRTDQPVVPFSWYRYIVMSEKDLAENGEAIVLHEKAHLRLRHSFDLLVTDLAGCLQWFNPAMWLLRRQRRRCETLSTIINKESCRREVVLSRQQL